MSPAAEYDARAYILEMAGPNRGVLGTLEHGFVPVPIAAAALRVQPTTIRSYVRRGTLEEVIVKGVDEKWKGVSLGSIYREVVRRLQRVSDLADEMRPFVHDAGPNLIEYGELMGLVGLSWRNPHDRSLVGEALGQLSEESLEHPDMGFLITANVVRKQGRRPNPSFFWLAQSLGQMDEDDDEEEFWSSQVKEIRKWHKKASKGWA